MALHHSDIVPSHHERPGIPEWISINHVGVALMEPTTCVDVPELHYYAESQILQDFRLVQPVPAMSLSVHPIISDISAKVIVLLY